MLSIGLALIYEWQYTGTLGLTGLTGLLFIVALLIVIRQPYKQQAMLEQLVQEQTAALQESREKYRKIYENIQDVYFEVAPDGAIIEIGHRIQELSKGQYKREDLLSRKFMEFVSDPEETSASIWRALKEHGRIHDWEVRYKNRDGSLTACAVSAAIEADSIEKSFKVIGMLYDITDRKQAEQRILTLSQAVEQSPVSVAITDPFGTIEYVNRKFEEASGYTHAEALGQNPRILKSGYQLNEFYKELWETISSGHEWHGELCNRRKNGEIYWESAFISPIRNHHGQIIHYLAIKEDITDRKHMQEQLQQRTEEAQVASRAKSQFLANISHEVRTPLNGVIGTVGLLLDSELSATQRHYAEVAHANGGILLSLLNNLLDFSRIETDQLELETLNFNLRVTLEDIVDALTPQAHEKDLKLTCQIAHGIPNFLLRGDPGRLRQALMILGSNAIKFTVQGKVTLAVSVASETERQITVRFAVHDTGIGIPPDKIKLLFNSFQPLDASTTRRFGGIGLGLALAKRLVEKMRGEIHVTSGEGQGSCFWFTAVFDKPSHPMHHQETPSVDLQGLRVLIVDDKLSNRLIVTEPLTRWRLRYEGTGSAQQALFLLREAHAAQDAFHVLITDMQIPDMDGMTLGAAIKADPDLCNTVLIMLTSVGQRGDAKKLENIGFAAYLTKPTQPDQLYDCLTTVIDHACVTRQIPAPLVTRHSLREARCLSLRILVAEDNDINQMIVLKLLKKIGHRTDAVANGQEALEALKTRPYDLVLMDIEMPVMDGLEATRLIRSGHAHVADPQIPIIAMTAHTAHEERERCLKAGMNDHIGKPINQKMLSQVLERWYPARLGNSRSVSRTDARMIANADDQCLEIPGVDTRLGLMRIGGDHDLYRRLLDRFVDMHSGAATVMRQAVNDGDLDQARRLAHNIKGVAGNLGANELEATARRMEQVLAENHSLQIEEFLANFEQSLTQLIHHLQSLPARRAQHGDSSHTAGAPEAWTAPDELCAALDRIAPHLRARKPKYCVEALQGIESLSWPAHLEAEVKQLSILARKYRFAESLNVLESLQRNLLSLENPDHG
ncbi:MAG: response regulator [Candidatus Competibacteraceae bacterium]|nr:response regulator [Candidatus Competibacteraceae bacterium]